MLLKELVMLHLLADQETWYSILASPAHWIAECVIEILSAIVGAFIFRPVLNRWFNKKIKSHDQEVHGHD